MYTLFIDTHYISLHLALFKDGLVIEEIKKEDVKHSTYFIPLLKELLEKNGFYASLYNSHFQEAEE